MCYYTHHSHKTQGLCFLRRYVHTADKLGMFVYWAGLSAIRPVQILVIFFFPFSTFDLLSPCLVCPVLGMNVGPWNGSFTYTDPGGPIPKFHRVWEGQPAHLLFYLRRKEDVASVEAHAILPESSCDSWCAPPDAGTDMRCFRWLWHGTLPPPKMSHLVTCGAWQESLSTHWGLNSRPSIVVANAVLQ